MLDGGQAVAVVGVGHGLAGALGHGGGCQELGHGGLPRPVAPHEADPHALVDAEGGVGDELAGTDTHGEVLDVDHARHGNGPGGQSHQNHQPLSPPPQGGAIRRISSGTAAASSW